MLPKTADYLIIGGGCMGTSVAEHLARRGAKNILLLEREKFLGMGSTGRAAGGVRYQFSTEVNIRLSLYSMEIIRHFEEHYDTSCDYRPVGYLFLLSTPQAVETFKRSIALQQSLGVEWVRYLEPGEIHALAPLVNLEGILGGSFCPRDGLADPNTLTQGFAKSAMRHGVQILTETPVTRIERLGARRFRVETPRGVVETPAVVCCAGPWSALIGAMVGLEIPIVPLRRQFFITGEFPYTPPDHPFTLEFATTLYFHPEANGLLVGMSNQDEKPGYNFAVDEEFRQKTIQRGVYRLPVLEHATIATEWVGLYEVTPDAHPILSASADLPGFYIAAGFSGHGVMHSPATGLVMSELILDGRAHSIDISMLDLERFREGRLVKEVNVI